MAMDKDEARKILAHELARYRAMSYADLKGRMGDVDAFETKGPSGAEYQIEIEVMWDGKPDADLRVMGGIDDGGLRSAFSPLTDDFVIAPDGTLMNYEVNFLNMGRNVDELMRKFKANLYLSKKTTEGCPAQWKEEGDVTLKPSQKMVGKVHEALANQGEAV